VFLVCVYSVGKSTEKKHSKYMQEVLNVTLLLFTDNTDIIPNLFPRQSMSDEDYDRFTFDLNPEYPTLRTRPQTEQKTNDEETEAYNSVNAQSPEESAPAIYELYKTPVSADSDDKSDLYFIGKFLVSLSCYYCCE
jgi:hypothetical protein